MPITFAPGAEPKPLPVMPDIPDDGSVYVIPLNRGLYTIINIADKPLIDGWSFSASNSRGNVWKVKAFRGSRGNGTDEDSYLHTIITGYQLTDHVDGCAFDNRRSNLRKATDSQNQYNRPLQSSNTSGFKGANWQKKVLKWQAYIAIDGHQKYLGLFRAGEGTYTINGVEYDRGLVDAALTYDMAAREFHKSFATLNFPIAGERSAITGDIRPMITG
jgi:hypothetical protein